MVDVSLPLASIPLPDTKSAESHYHLHLFWSTIICTRFRYTTRGKTQPPACARLHCKCYMLWAVIYCNTTVGHTTSYKAWQMGIHYQLRGMASGVTGDVLAHELGSSRQSALLGSLDLAAPAASSPSAVRMHGMACQPVCAGY
eukprot:scaffold111603_cov19-Tisochrysis_lutea.AAC.1